MKLVGSLRLDHVLPRSGMRIFAFSQLFRTRNGGMLAKKPRAREWGEARVMREPSPSLKCYKLFAVRPLPSQRPRYTQAPERSGTPTMFGDVDKLIKDLGGENGLVRCYPRLSDF